MSVFSKISAVVAVARIAEGRLMLRSNRTASGAANDTANDTASGKTDPGGCVMDFGLFHGTCDDTGLDQFTGYLDTGDFVYSQTALPLEGCHDEKDCKARTDSWGKPAVPLCMKKEEITKYTNNMMQMPCSTYQNITTCYPPQMCQPREDLATAAAFLCSADAEKANSTNKICHDQQALSVSPNITCDRAGIATISHGWTGWSLGVCDGFYTYLTLKKLCLTPYLREKDLYTILACTRVEALKKCGDTPEETLCNLCTKEMIDGELEDAFMGYDAGNATPIKIISDNNTIVHPTYLIKSAITKTCSRMVFKSETTTTTAWNFVFM